MLCLCKRNAEALSLLPMDRKKNELGFETDKIIYVSH
jgi:hypothetical protein